jgi:hypothetical protein
MPVAGTTLSTSVVIMCLKRIMPRQGLKAAMKKQAFKMISEKQIVTADEIFCHMVSHMSLSCTSSTDTPSRFRPADHVCPSELVALTV